MKIFMCSKYRLAVILMFTLLITSLLSACNEEYAPLPTVGKVELSRYLGKWYQVALIPNRFQSMCVADTQAEYELTGDSIKVTNRCRKIDGSIEQANGIANVVEGERNAKLRVSFFRPFYGNYWILDLDTNYQWVLIGEPSRKYGWILSRTPQLDAQVQRQLLDKAESLGYRRDAFQISPQGNPIN